MPKPLITKNITKYSSDYLFNIAIENLQALCYYLYTSNLVCIQIYIFEYK